MAETKPRKKSSYGWMLLCTALLIIIPLVVGLHFSKSRAIVGTWQANTGCGPFQLTFNKDGTGFASGFPESFDFTWKIEGDQLVITESSGETESIPFVLEKNTLKLETSGDKFTLTRLG